jgi:hypothetical protein
MMVARLLSGHAVIAFAAGETRPWVTLLIPTQADQGFIETMAEDFEAGVGVYRPQCKVRQIEGKQGAVGHDLGEWEVHLVLGVEECLN